MDFKFYNLHITQESKTAWEQGLIKNPRLSLKGSDKQDLTIDEVENILIESIRDSFSELREVISINEFSEAKIIMPSLQMVSNDKLDVVDFGLIVIDPIAEEDEYIEEETLSDWNHPSEMWEEFAEMMADESDGEIIEDESEILEEDTKVSEDEMDIIKKRLNGL